MFRNMHSSANMRTRVIGLFALITLVGLFAFACGADDEAAAPAAAPAAAAAPVGESQRELSEGVSLTLCPTLRNLRYKGAET